MGSLYTSVYKGFIIASAVSFLLYFFTTGNTAFGSLIAGYSVLSLGIMLILIFLINSISKITNQTTKQLLMSSILISFPFLLILGIIGILLYLIIVNKSRIVDGNVADYFYSFNNIIVILILLQVYIIYKNIDTQQFETTNRISKMTASLCNLISVLAGICTLIVYIVLTYYKTDGFETLQKYSM